MKRRRHCLPQPGPARLVLPEAWAVGVAIIHPVQLLSADQGPGQVEMRKMRQAAGLRNKRHKASASGSRELAQEPSKAGAEGHKGVRAPDAEQSMIQ